MHRTVYSVCCCCRQYFRAAEFGYWTCLDSNTMGLSVQLQAMGQSCASVLENGGSWELK